MSQVNKQILKSVLIDVIATVTLVALVYIILNFNSIFYKPRYTTDSCFVPTTASILKVMEVNSAWGNGTYRVQIATIWGRAFKVASFQEFEKEVMDLKEYSCVKLLN